jgi:hypothetical protein
MRGGELLNCLRCPEFFSKNQITALLAAIYLNRWTILQIKSHFIPPLTSQYNICFECIHPTHSSIQITIIKQQRNKRTSIYSNQSLM